MKLEKDNWLEISTSFTNPSIKARFSLRSFPMDQVGSRKSFANSVGFGSKDLIITEQTHSNNVIFF